MFRSSTRIDIQTNIDHALQNFNLTNGLMNGLSKPKVLIDFLDRYVNNPQSPLNDRQILTLLTRSDKQKIS